MGIFAAACLQSHVTPRPLPGTARDPSARAIHPGITQFLATHTRSWQRYNARSSSPRGEAQRSAAQRGTARHGTAQHETPNTDTKIQRGTASRRTRAKTEILSSTSFDSRTPRVGDPLLITRINSKRVVSSSSSTALPRVTFLLREATALFSLPYTYTRLYMRAYI